MKWLVCWLLPAALWAQPQYDLLLRGGHVIDPKNSIDAVRDVAISGGKIAAVEASIDPARAKHTVDLTGLYVTPGLIDIHTHLYASAGVPGSWAGDNSVYPDSFSFRTCTTTMVDAGSAGWRNFDDFRARVIDRAQTRVFSLINVAALGMMTDAMEQVEEDMQPARIAEVGRRNKDVVVGIKSAHFQKPGWTSVDRAIEAAKLLQVPVMVDFGYFLPERPYWQLVTQRLRPGDISTHMFRGPVAWIDSEGKVYDYLKKARARGVKFDVGHGGGSLVLRNAVPAIRQGFYPDSISTDLHTGSMNGAMMDLQTTMSKLMAAGLPLKEAIRETTWNPAQMIQKPALGHLTKGSDADVAVWNVMKGNFYFRDASEGRIAGKERLFCEMTVRAGKVVWDWNSRLAEDFEKLPADYGVRPGIDKVIPPPH